jgi:hypothetical protein
MGEWGLVKMALSSEHDGIKQDKLGFLPNKAFTRKPWFSFSERIGIFQKQYSFLQGTCLILPAHTRGFNAI